jgi:peptide/nickel transport system permease protein
VLAHALAHALRRLPSALLLLALASIVVFGALRLVPGDPAVLLAGPDATPDQMAALRHQLGLDSPLPVQYWDWLRGLVTARPGYDLVRHAPVADLIGRGTGNTLELTTAALLLTLVLGLPLGCLGAVVDRPVLRWMLTAITTIGVSVPSYVAGVVMVLVLAIWLRLLPPGGHVSLLDDPEIGVQYLVMPALCLSLHSAVVIARFLEQSLRRAMSEDYVRTAVAKGVPPVRILLRHALPNALPPVIAIAGVHAGHLLGGAVVVEALFAWPGLGQLAVHSIQVRDYGITQDLVLLGVALFTAIQVLTDLCCAALDPRLRLER